MARRILDPKLMAKLAKKLGRKSTAINVMVSHRATKLGISSEAALINIAREHGIGAAIYQRTLDNSKQAEVRSAFPIAFPAQSQSSARSRKIGGGKPAADRKANYRGAIEFLIEDQELRERCQDLLLAPRHFDRAINQATLVLEDRIRTKAQPTVKLVGENLVSYSFKEDLSTTVLRVASNDSDEQRGFIQTLRGVVPTFRNKTHHHIIKSFSREEAMRVCGFIDVLLRVVDNSVKLR